jgi:3-methyladenine DNA glycosylase/8-oxoguanine DNA glycosylase
MALVGLEVLCFHVALGITHTRVDCRENTRHIVVKVQKSMRVFRRWAEFYLWHIYCATERDNNPVSQRNTVH